MPAYPRTLPNRIRRFIVITRTPRAVTCVATETHKNVTKPQGSSLCKQNCHVPHADSLLEPLCCKAFLHYSIPARRNFLYFAFCCEPFVGPVGTASVAPFVGPDDALSPLRWMSTHLHCCRTTQGSLADSFLLLSQYSQPCTNPLSSVYERTTI